MTDVVLNNPTSIIVLPAVSIGPPGVQGPQGVAGPQGAPGSVPYYIDQVLGVDTNNGLSPTAPIRTFARLATLLGTIQDCSIRLRRGRIWREQLTLGNNVDIDAYGDGQLPIIDARDQVPNSSFSATAGRVNVHQFAWTPLAGLGIDIARITVWENGLAMMRAASLNECESTAGSFYAAFPTANTAQTVYVHLADNGNPASNGKQYLATKREASISLANQNGGHLVSIKNVRGIAGLSNNGTFSVLGKALISGCVLEWGTKHHCVASGGTVENCLFLDCVEWVGNTTDCLFLTHFVAATATENISGIVKGCTFAASKKIVGSNAYYCHGSGSYYVEDVALINNTCINLDTGMSPAAFLSQSIIGNTFMDCTLAISCDSNPIGGTIVNVFDNIQVGGNRFLQYTFAPTTLNVVNNRSNARLNALFCTPSACFGKFRNNTFIGQNAPGSICFSIDATSSANLDITITNNIIDGYSWTWIAGAAALGDFTASNNQYGTVSGFLCNVGSTNYNSLAAWQATGRDAGSQNSANIWSGSPARGDFDPAPSAPALTIGAGWQSDLLADLKYDRSKLIRQFGG